MWIRRASMPDPRRKKSPPASRRMTSLWMFRSSRGSKRRKERGCGLKTAVESVPQRRLCRCAGTVIPFRRDSRAGQKRPTRVCFDCHSRNAAPDVRVWFRFSCIVKKRGRGGATGRMMERVDRTTSLYPTRQTAERRANGRDSRAHEKES